MTDLITRAAEVMAPVVWRDMQPDFVPSAPNDYDALTEEAQEIILHYTTMLAQALDAAGLLASPDRPGVEIESRLGQPDTCVVTHRGVIVFDGVDRSALLRTESAAAHDAAVAAEWADHFEVCQGTVGIERLTVESMIAALRGPRPFGCMAGEPNADA